jgi:adenosylhomocysteine nucleosidase
MKVGDVGIAGKVFMAEAGRIDFGGEILLPEYPRIRELLQSVGDKRGFDIYSSEAVTSSGILSKRALCRELREDLHNPVLDMETYAIAEETGGVGIPLLALRAISDADDEEIELSLDRITDRDMNVRIWKVLLEIARNPRMLPQLLRLARNSSVAGRNLAAGIKSLLDEDLHFPVTQVPLP